MEPTTTTTTTTWVGVDVGKGFHWAVAVGTEGEILLSRGSTTKRTISRRSWKRCAP